MSPDTRYLMSSKKQSGFTLIELVIVISIIGIISYVAIANFDVSNTKLQYESALQKIVTDVRYARELATTHGQGTHVYIDPATNEYWFKWEDGNYIQNPVKGGDFVIQLGTGNFNGVQITASAFSGSLPRLDFDTGGSPLNNTNTFSGTLNLVTLNSSKKIVVYANTGFLKIEDL